MQAVGHAIKTWFAVCLIALHSLFGQMKLPNSRLQAIGLNPSFSKQANSNRLITAHGYESAEPGYILTLLHVPSVIRPLGDTQLVRSI